MTKNIDKKKLTKKVNSMGVFQKLNKKQQQIILLLSAFESKGLIPTYLDLSKYLNNADKGYLSRLIKDLRKLKIVLPKINRLDTKGKEMLTFLRGGLRLSPLRAHDLATKFEVLSIPTPFKFGQFFRSGRNKSIKGYKQIIGKTWTATLYLGNKEKSLYVILDAFYSKDIDNFRFQLTRQIDVIEEEFRQMGIITGRFWVKEQELAYISHPLAEWYYNNFGVGGTKELWVDQSLGVPELETNNPELMEAVVTAFEEVGTLINKGKERLTKEKGGLFELDVKKVDKNT